MRVFHGLFLECDVPLAEFLRELNNTQSFIIVDIDDTHLLVKNTADTLKFLKVKIEEWQDGNTYHAGTVDDEEEEAKNTFGAIK